MNEAHRICDTTDWRAFVRNELVPRTLDGLDLGASVLEIGPGYGATTEVFADMVPWLACVEIDPALAERLRRRLSSQVSVVHADATQLPFSDGRFSGAVCFSMLHHVGAPRLQNRLFSETARVLRQGGLLVAVDSLESDELLAFHEGDTYQPVDPESLRARLPDAGFGSVELRMNEHGWVAVARRAP